MAPKKLLLRPGQPIPGTESSPATQDGVAAALETNNTNSEKEKSSSKSHGGSSNKHKKSSRGVKLSAFEVMNSLESNTPIPSTSVSSSTNEKKKSDEQQQQVPNPATPGMASPTTTTATSTSTNTNHHHPYPDDDCDLCNERVLNGELHTSHVAVEHAIMQTWMDTISSDEEIAKIVNNKKNQVSVEKAKEIGQLAIEIAKKKDGGPLVWQSALNVWKQIRSSVRHKTLELRVFGSCVAMGTWDGVGDVDLCFVRPPPKSSSSSSTKQHDDDKKNANDDDEEYIKSTAASNTSNSVPYNMESVSDPKKEVHYVSRCLRDAGFAFDDLEPVLHARVPIVKHHHKAPEAKDRSGWEAIATRPDARTITFRFSGPKLAEGILDMLTNHAPGSRWENGGRDFILVNEDTNRAVENYVDPWANYMKPVINNYVAMMKTKIHDLEQEAKSDPSKQQELTKAQKFANDAERWNKSSFYSAAKHIDWYSNKFFHFPEMFHCDFDLSFRAHGIRNSILLRSYFSQTPLARVGALLVKQWSKETAVNLSMRGYWTTYCINIVWIAFLIHKKLVKFVDPRSIPVFLTDEQFENEIFQYIPTLGSEETNDSVLNDSQKIGSLLFEFFYYYGYEFDWSKNVVTLRQDQPFKREEVSTAPNPWTLDNEIRTGKFRDRVWYRLCVDDPYEDNLSLGRHLSQMKATRILTHFRLMALKLMNHSNSSSSNNLKQYNNAPLLPSLKPDSENLSPAYFRHRFVRWFVGHKKMALPLFIENFISKDSQDLLTFGSANSFMTLSKLLELANACITYDDEGKPENRSIFNAYIQLSNERSNFISKELFAAVLEIEKHINDTATTTSTNKDDDDKSNGKQGFHVTAEFAKQHKITGNYINPLKTFFDFTYLYASQEFRIFKTKVDMDAFVLSKKGGGGGGAVATAAAVASGDMKDRRDASRSWIGTCDDCGSRQRRLYSSVINKNDRSGYCESCWDIYEKS